MESPQPEPTSAFILFIHGCFAAIGGLVRELTTMGEHNTLKFISGAVIGVFCGLLVYCLCRHFEWESWMTGAFTGLGGYMGTPLLDIISKQVKKKMRKL